MANSILTPQQNSCYQLSASDRQAILSKAPCPGGNIPRAACQQIAKQRAVFVKIAGTDGIEPEYSLSEVHRQKILQWAKVECECGENNVKFHDI